MYERYELMSSFCIVIADSPKRYNRSIHCSKQSNFRTVTISGIFSTPLIKYRSPAVFLLYTCIYHDEDSSTSCGAVLFDES